MRSLFGKIFLWFCSTVVLGIFFAFVVGYLLNLPGPERGPGPINHLLRITAQDMTHAYEAEGQAGVRKFIDILESRTDLDSRLFDLDGNDLSGLETRTAFAEAMRRHLAEVPMPPPEEIRNRIAELRPHQPPDFSPENESTPSLSHGKLIVSRWVFSKDGTPYIYVSRLPSPIRFFRRFARAPFFIRLGIFFAAGVVLSYLLARYLSGPVRRLQSTAQRMRSGDLSARVGSDKGLRYTEIRDLARDFDSMADRLERMVDSQQRLVRDVSHELRSPLTRLNLSLELARKRPGAEAVGTDLDRIGRDVDRLQELIDEVLAFARLDNIRDDWRTDTVNLGALLVAVTRDADLEAQAREVALKVDVQATAVLAANQELLRRAMENVIRNAIRHTPRRSTIDICLARLEHSGEILLQVRDYGTGAPEEQLDDLFKPFFRADDSRTRATGGTGLGLAIAARAVRMHGGAICAANAPGGGLVVDIRLPER